ncbi:hypothetical protein lerEdw1_019904 [Lerista edwardsae]|nr:hypothetical protein lerEdw1_019904 [Lerista edwardsae]
MQTDVCVFPPASQKRKSSRIASPASSPEVRCQAIAQRQEALLPEGRQDLGVMDQGGAEQQGNAARKRDETKWNPYPQSKAYRRAPTNFGPGGVFCASNL